MGRKAFIREGQQFLGVDARWADEKLIVGAGGDSGHP